MCNIQNATYTICLDNGTEVSCKCKVIMDTHELYDFEEVSYNDSLDWIDQYVTLQDGSEHEAHCWEYVADYCGDEDTSDWYWFR